MVDDELDITFSVKTALEDRGLFQVDTFNDAESVLCMFKPDVYDLALLDIRMPNMDGFQLCRKLMEVDNKIKICFLTAAELTYYREKESDIINKLGRDCFIPKPINNEDIIGRLKAILSENKQAFNGLPFAIIG
jgi:DNA-binding response OmpR family regulator